MMTLIAAAVLAAQPAGSAPANPQAQQAQHMQMGEAPDHKGMDCCKDCCKDMAKEHEDHRAAHDGHSGQ